MPVRLAIFLAGLCLFAIFIVGNSERIQVFLIVGIWEMSVGRLILISTGFGAFMVWLLLSHLGSYRKFRSKAKEAKRTKSKEPKGKPRAGAGQPLPPAAGPRPPSEAFGKKKRKKVFGLF